MARKDLKQIIPKAYWYLLKWFIWITENRWEKIPSRVIEGGARLSGKTFNYFILLFLIAIFLPNTLGVVVRLKGAKQVPDTWDQLMIIIKHLGIEKDIKSYNSTQWKITFNNGSQIILRSVYDPQGNIAMKGVPRQPDCPLAIIINEECNTFTRTQLGMAGESVTAKKILRWDLFNTDSVKQSIVKEMQDIIPVNMTIMKSKGFQQKMDKSFVKNKWDEEVLEKTWVRRSNHIPIKELIPDAKYRDMMQTVKNNPIRAKVSVWGDNGSTGKRLFSALEDKHFINTKGTHLPDKLPSSLFKRYRIGIDTAEQHDKYAVTLSGLTHQNRLVAIEQYVVKPKKEQELIVTELVESTFRTITMEWGTIYENMKMDTRIRVETAGNGTTVKQMLTSKFRNFGWNITIDKCKKTIETTHSRGNVGSVAGTSQPILEERAAACNGFFASGQKLFWNASQDTRDEYEVSREENGRIKTDGGDDIRQAYDYGEIPEYKNMWANPPKISFAEELTACGIKI